MGSAKWLNTFQTASHRSIHQRCPQGTVLSSFSKPVRTSTVMLLWACGWRSTLICIEERATYFSAHQTSKTTRLKSQNMASRYTYGCNNITSWYMYIYIYKLYMDIIQRFQTKNAKLNCFPPKLLPFWHLPPCSWDHSQDLRGHQQGPENRFWSVAMGHASLQKSIYLYIKEIYIQILFKMNKVIKYVADKVWQV